MKFKFLIVSITFAFFSAQSFAAAYLKFDGVDGEATDKGHREWIEVLSVSQATAPSDTASGMATGKRDAASGLPTGKRQHKPVTITKSIDKASPMLARALSSGAALTNVKIKNDGHVTVLKRAEVLSICQDAKGTETVVLAETNTSKATVAYSAEATKKKGNVETSWKVEEGER
ncbi:MAG: type VI secretion system tube protein Hcp [Pseudomonadales bacterium]